MLQRFSVAVIEQQRLVVLTNTLLNTIEVLLKSRLHLSEQYTT